MDEVVTQWFSSVSRRRRYRSVGKSKVEVLLPEIRKAVEDGLSFKRFYIENKTRLDLSYSQFSRILHTLKIDYELETEKPQTATAMAKVASNEKTQPQRAEPLFVETEKARTFNWDPVACYSKKYD